MIACFGVLPDTAASRLPIADVAEHLIGPAGATLMAVAAVVSCAGGLTVQFLVTPRNVFAFGEAGDLPRAFVAVHRVFRTPWVSIVACVALVATASFQAVRDVVIVMLVGLAIRALVRRRSGRSTIRSGGKPP